MNEPIAVKKPAEPSQKKRHHLDRIAWILDNSIPVPGLGGYRIGVDSLLGLVPGIGDALGAALSTYILGEAVRLGAPKSVLLRMFFNIMIESVIGIIPFAGDIFDMTWKANARNVKLLERYWDNPDTTARSSRFLAVGVMVLVFLILGLLISLSWLILKGLLSLINA
ncbi:MAG TPA: DUF4112 domain-containing protein [Candidatus Competibacter sp.]|nr:DUF4112 domain-containing protein [Candidatus Competibacter sp.]HUM93947.1 DUF4112 domain-containing protein [Candidatus Competibacter sp.]